MKLRVLFYSFFILFFLVLQTTLLNYAAIRGIMPDILIVFIIITALVRGNTEGGVVGFFAGLAMDMMFGGVLGFYALFGLYLGIAAGSVNRRLFRENLLVALLFTYIFSAGYEVLVYIFNNIINGNMMLLYTITRVILPKALYNCAVAVLLYPLLLKADKRFKTTSKSVGKY